MKEILLPYQQRWIADRAPIKVCEKSRRIGITWAEAADAALDAAGRNGTDWWYIGYNKDMAREFIEDAAGWARRFNQAARAIEEIAIEDEDKDILAFRIRFASGNKIVALSSRPSNLRGKQGVAVIDEAAFHEHLPSLIKAALAFTMWGGRVHVISTHFGAGNAFNELIADIRAAAVRIHYIASRSTTHSTRVFSPSSNARMTTSLIGHQAEHCGAEQRSPRRAHTMTKPKRNGAPNSSPNTATMPTKS